MTTTTNNSSSVDNISTAAAANGVNGSGSSGMATLTTVGPSTSNTTPAVPSTLGASLSSRSSDISTSNSVINSSSSVMAAGQSNEQSWLENPMSSGWDKPAGSQPGTPRLDHQSQTTSQFSGWGQPSFPAAFGGSDVRSSGKWGGSPTSGLNSSSGNNSMQSAWGSSSPNLARQQSGATDSWGMPSANPMSTTGSSQWGLPSASAISAAATDSQNSWGQPKRLPNAGTDGWGQSVASSGGQSNPSSASSAAQVSQWGQQQQQSVPSTQPSSTWPATNSSNAVSNQQPPPPTQSVSQSASGAIIGSAISSSSSTVMPQSQWGANSSAGQSEPVMSPTSSISGGLPSPSKDASSQPTSWAGAAAKGLPKAVPKPPEPVDPVRLAIEQTINNPEGWGKVPVRQDTAWGKPPEKKKQDDSNQWQATPNNGTAIWDAVKNAQQGQAPKYEDKSTWNQKVIGNEDPNVWNGEGSKGKDNALWDNVPTTKESESIDQTNQWNAAAPQARTISQSSGGGESSTDNGWNPNPSTVVPSTRISPPNTTSQPPTMSSENSSWGSQNGPVDPRKLNRWDSNPGSTSMRMNNMSDTGGSYWDGSSQHRSSGPGNWNSKPQGAWPNDNGLSNSAAWGGQSQTSGNQGGWGDGPSSGNQWNSARKPSFSWEDSQNGGGGGADFGRDRRQYKSESDPNMYETGDADMGDWNESNSVWSSANGFKSNVRKHATIPENNMPPHMVPGRGGGGGGGMPNSGQYNGPPRGMPAGMGGSAGNMGGGGGNLTKHQMLTFLVNQMKFSREEAHHALITHDMNFQGAMSELIAKNSNNMQPPQSIGGMPGGPMGENTFNPSIPPPNIPSNINTPFNSNAQFNQSAGPGSSRNKPNPPRAPIGRVGAGNSVQQQQQRVIVQQLQHGVKTGNIFPQILNLPLTDHNLRSIQNLLSLQNSYQQHNDQMMQLQTRGIASGPQYESLKQTLTGIYQQMNNLQQPLLRQVPQKMGLPDGLSDGISNMSMSSQGSGSRLDLWTNRAPGSLRQGALSMNTAAVSSSLHSSHSTPNLQGNSGGVSDANPWSSSATPSNSGAGSGMWSNISPGAPFTDNQSESQSATNGGPLSASTANSSSAAGDSTFDIPEFVPGKPWQGANNSKVEDDPNITPGSVARSLSVSTAIQNGSGRDSTDLGWASALGQNAKSTWSSEDMWTKPAGTRPPPGFNKNMNRSMSMPQGPSEKSAFSPVGSGWSDSHGSSLNSGFTWLVLRNLTPQIDSATLKTLCSQHGPLLNFFVNQNNGQALVQYATRHEGQKAHKSLNTCVLGNTTIMTEFVDENEVQRIIDQCQRQGNIARSQSLSTAPGSSMWPNTNNNSSSTSNLWGSSMGSGSTNSTWGGLGSGLDMGGGNHF